jgi:hypothetical protein
VMDSKDLKSFIILIVALILMCAIIYLLPE